MKGFPLIKVSIRIFNCEVLRYTTKYSSDVTIKFIEIWGESATTFKFAF